MMHARWWVVGVGIAFALGSAGCDDKDKASLAPAASALTASKAAAGARPFAIEKTSSKVDFMMEAPQEKIRGKIAGATDGDLSIDPTDATKTTGLIALDLGGIELFQTKADDKGNFGEESKNDLQNKHVRTWLEISDDTPADVRAKNAHVEFAIRSITAATPKDVSTLSGNERKVSLKAVGDLLLHGHKKETTADLEATFHYQGDQPTSVTIKTAKPFAVPLSEFDVRPREAFGKLAQKTLDVLAPKVAKEAQVDIELTAIPRTPAAAATAGAK